MNSCKEVMRFIAARLFVSELKRLCTYTYGPFADNRKQSTFKRPGRRFALYLPNRKYKSILNG